jgi:hypothetical protein
MNHSPNSNTNDPNYYNSTQVQPSPSIHIINDTPNRAALQQQQQQQQQQQLLQQQNQHTPTNNSNLLTTSNLTTQQQQPSSSSTTTPNTTRVINRNYLQIQPSNYGNQSGLNKSTTLSSHGQLPIGNNQQSSSMYGGHQQPFDPNRTRSISNSLKNLFHRPPSNKLSQTRKREKSYDTPSMLLQPSTGIYDTQSGLSIF